MVVIVRSCMLQLQAALRADVGEAGEELTKSTVQPFSLPLLMFSYYYHY